MMYRDRVRCATDEQLRGVVAFFDVPELRKYYSGLLEDVKCELMLREEKGDSDHAPRSE